MLTAAVLVGTTGTAQALGPQSATPLGIGAVRAVLGAVALGALALGARNARPDRGTGIRSPRLIALGAIGVAVYQPAFFIGVDQVGVAVGTIVAIGSGPAFAGLMAAGLGRTPPPLWWWGTCLAVAGGAVMILAQNGASPQSINLIGVAAALAAGFGYALYTTTAQLAAEHGADPTAVLAVQFGLGSLVLVPVLFIEPMDWLATSSGLIMALHLGVITIGLAYGLVGYALARIDAPLVTTLFQAEPVTAAGLAVVVLHETLPAVAWLGALAVIAGLLLATRSPAPATGTSGPCPSPSPGPHR